MWVMQNFNINRGHDQSIWLVVHLNPCSVLCSLLSGDFKILCDVTPYSSSTFLPPPLTIIHCTICAPHLSSYNFTLTSIIFYLYTFFLNYLMFFFTSQVIHDNIYFYLTDAKYKLKTKYILFLIFFLASWYDSTHYILF